MGMTDRQFDAYRKLWLDKLKTIQREIPSNKELNRAIRDLEAELSKQ
jgi:hypothetical protein